MFKWEVIADIINFNPKSGDSLKLGNVKISQKNGTWIGELQLEADNLDIAYHSARERLTEALTYLSFYFDGYLDFQIRECMQISGMEKIGAAEIFGTITVVLAQPQIDDQEIGRLFELSQKIDKIGKYILDYYRNGLRRRSSNESFLDFFKAMELVAARREYLELAKAEKKDEMSAAYDEYMKKLREAVLKNENDEEINKLSNEIYRVGLIEVQRKFACMLQDLRINVDDAVLKDMIKKRNLVAHGSGERIEVEQQLVLECKDLARRIISNYQEKFS